MQIPPKFLPLTSPRHARAGLIVETLLEFAAASNATCDDNRDLFSYLIKHGAQFDPNAPYLPLSFTIGQWESFLYDDLIKLGASKFTRVKTHDSLNIFNFNINYRY